MLIDTHIHLDAPEFDLDREAVIEAARVAGVRRFIVPAVERQNFDAVEALTNSHADVAFALGIHPLYVGGATAADLEVLDFRLGASRAIAVGEIGLDQFVATPAIELQTEYFVAQLKLARKHGLPVILHVRRAVDAVLKALRRIEVPGGIAHSFNGSLQQAHQFIDMGFKLGFGGAMTFTGSTRIRSLAAELPLSALVLETDAPDISPAWRHGARTEPADLAEILKLIAVLRSDTPEHVAAATANNVHQIFGRGARFGTDR